MGTDADKSSKKWAKLSQCYLGTVLIADEGFTCMAPGEKIVARDGDGELFVECADGYHYLSGQAYDGEHLVGFYMKEQQS